MTPHHPDHLRVAIAQIAPVLLDRDATLEKVHARVREAADAGARLVAFPETIVPGYPTWLARTDGARFDDPLQKELHSRYLDQALELPGPELQQLLALSSEVDVAIVLGCAERGRQAGRGTLWASALWIGTDGSWSSHRKLVPTYEERLAWGPGDGHGLRVHDRDGWRVGALNCWENWMPAARMSLQLAAVCCCVFLNGGLPAQESFTHTSARHPVLLHVLLGIRQFLSSSPGETLLQGSVHA